MNSHQPWVMDIRQSDLRHRFTKSGFPKIKSSRFAKYRTFTIQCTVLMVVVMGTTLLAYLRPLVLINQREFSTPSGNEFERSFYKQATRRKGVVVLSNHRSGSTFFGQLFNQRADSFFFYEPLEALDSHCSPEHERKKVILLHNLLRCNIRDQDSSEDDPRRWKNCGRNNFCFREKSKAMCSPPLCTGGDPATCRGCGLTNVTRASELCHNRDVIATKIIRLCDVTSLKPILEDPTLDVKVLHLIRDPRGQLNSKDQLYKAGLNKNGEDSVATTCGKIKRNIDASKTNDWLNGKYRIIRYEDLCRNPLETARSVYEFIGVHFPRDIEEWILSNTNGGLDRLDARGSKIVNKFNKSLRKLLSTHLNSRQLLQQTILTDPYSTTRNSSANWRKWQSTLTYQQVEYVQSVCKPMFAELNYRILTSEKQLKDENIKLLDDLIIGKSL